ncbi:hypothetical protein EV356DRAFT_536790 [Viridothelium virens]|uniref:Uncharacterized protein n=1 Tax=Viridothelium virens TaxID=1048519 RepID=A0A6A6GWG8_VIRVR|nr:hypothetical protein EV356DRAFT_536790 [Viridothelium virens]
MEDPLLTLSLDSDPEEPTSQASKNDSLPTNRGYPRDYQSEADFQAVKASYRPKIENGELYKSLPLSSSTGSNNEEKPKTRQEKKRELEALSAAVAELYFFRRYDKVLEILHVVLDEEGEGYGIEIGEGKERERLERWREKCHMRLEERNSRERGQPSSERGRERDQLEEML